MCCSDQKSTSPRTPVATTPIPPFFENPPLNALVLYSILKGLGHLYGYPPADINRRRSYQHLVFELPPRHPSPPVRPSLPVVLAPRRDAPIPVLPLCDLGLSVIPAIVREACPLPAVVAATRRETGPPAVVAPTPAGNALSARALRALRRERRKNKLSLGE